jgi:hypothetical protein
MNIDQEMRLILDQVVECFACIDGYRPAPVDPVIGAYYETCTNCVPPCSMCRGAGLFVVACCLTHFAYRLNTEHGLIPILCPACEGLIHAELIEDPSA